MSISAMKQALEALTYIYTETTKYEEKVMDEAIAVLEQAIAEAENQEPMAWFGDADGFPVYAAPPKREWVGLTDEEIKKEQHHIDWTSAHTYAKFARAIEAKLKEKNT